MTNYRNDAVEAAIARALKLAVAPSRLQLTVRGFENVLDAGTAVDQWRTAAIAAVSTAAVPAAYSCFQAVAAPVMAATRLAVFYKVMIETVPCPVAVLTFRTGGALGNITAEFDLEQLVNALETEGYFSQPVVIEPNEVWAAQVTGRIATGVFARVQLGGYIIEPVGRLIA